MHVSPGQPHGDAGWVVGIVVCHATPLATAWRWWAAARRA